MEGKLQTAQTPTRPKADWPPLGIRVHPELKRRLKAKSSMEGLKMEEYLHRLLCHDLDCEGLTVQPAAAS